MPKTKGDAHNAAAPVFSTEPLRSVAQQFVYTGLGPGLFVDPLDDDRAIEVNAVLAGHRARDNNAVGRHFAIEYVATFAVEDLGRLADKHAHPKHRAFADDHPFDHFRAGADKAVVLDDGWSGLHRFQHTADPHSAREVFLPIWAQLPTVAHVSTIVPLST